MAGFNGLSSYLNKYAQLFFELIAGMRTPVITSYVLAEA
jgi:hypothetical protein